MENSQDYRKFKPTIILVPNQKIVYFRFTLTLNHLRLTFYLPKKLVSIDKDFSKDISHEFFDISQKESLLKTCEGNFRILFCHSPYFQATELTFEMTDGNTRKLYAIHSVGTCIATPVTCYNICLPIPRVRNFSNNCHINERCSCFVFCISSRA